MQTVITGLYMNWRLPAGAAYRALSDRLRIIRVVSTRRVDDLVQAMGLSGDRQQHRLQAVPRHRRMPFSIARWPAAGSVPVAGCDRPRAARGRPDRAGSRARARSGWIFQAATALKRTARRAACVAAFQDAGGEPEPDTRRNFTDPESRIMPGRDGFIQAYNGQVAVDADQQIILTCRPTNSGSDQDGLPTLLDAAAANAARVRRRCRLRRPQPSPHAGETKTLTRKLAVRGQAPSPLHTARCRHGTTTVPSPSQMQKPRTSPTEG